MSSETEEGQPLGGIQGEEAGGAPEGSGDDLGALQDQEPVPGEVQASEEVDPVTALEGEAAKWKDAALRSQAELENFRKRMAREKSEAIKFGNSGLLESLLPIVDSFQFGLDAARQESEDSVVFQGMSMVYKQLNDLLEEFGVEEVQAEGQTFDPNLHDAVKQEPSDEVEAGQVLSVIRRGYKLHDRLLRAANVVVSTGAAEVEAAPGEQEVEAAVATEEASESAEADSSPNSELSLRPKCRRSKTTTRLLE